MVAKDLIDSLIELTITNQGKAQELKSKSIDLLRKKKNAESWSVLECIEHLNRYGDYYIPEIENKMKLSAYQEHGTFKSGLLGNYFAKSMLPGQKMNKMKTFKSMDPLNCSLDKNVLDKFIRQQEQLLKLLEQARTTNLTKVKTSISISKWIKIRLGDTFRVVVYHNVRHLVQAEKVLKCYTKSL